MPKTTTMTASILITCTQSPITIPSQTPKIPKSGRTRNIGAILNNGGTDMSRFSMFFFRLQLSLEPGTRIWSPEKELDAEVGCIQ